MLVNEKKDRRRFKRLPINLRLVVDEIFKQDYVVMKDVNAFIYVSDISKSGLGFVSRSNLPIGYYFTVYINLGDGDFFRAVIRIVRGVQTDHEQYVYGAEFVGLAPFLADKLDKYEKKLNKVT